MSGFIDLFADCLGSTVTLEPYVGPDPYGRPTYGAPVRYAARVQGRNRLIRTLENLERISTVQVYLDGTAASSVSPKDRLTLSTDFVPNQPPLLAINTETDETGALAYVALYA